MKSYGYWQTRINRRRAIQAASAGAGTIGIMALLGCSSGGSNQKTAELNSSRVEQPKNTSAQAKRGGIYKDFAANDETSLDPLATSRGGGFGGAMTPAHSRLLREVAQPVDPKEPKIEGDLAESFELTNGGLQLTVKLRANAKFDPRAPTNGRNVTADDVLFSWNRFAAVSPYATQLSNKADATAPVESVQKVDDRTLVYKMAFPYSPLLLVIAHGNHLIQPQEVDGKMDPRNTVRGTGPWMLEEYQTAQYFRWRRNPNWYGEQSYIDGYDATIIPQTATQEAQFLAKNIWSLLPRPDSVPDLISSNSALRVIAGESGLGHAGRTFLFGSRPGSPFYDIRVRRAVSMGIDRQLFAETDTGSERLKAAGLPRDVYLDGPLPASYRPAGYWLDPKGNSLGEGAKYYEHNVTEAKKLMAAAGYANGIEMDGTITNTGAHITEQVASILAEMLSEIGLRLKLKAVDYQTVYLPKYYVSGAVKGDYDGLSWASQAPFRQAHVLVWLYGGIHSKGGFSAARRWDAGQDKIDSLIEQAFREFDPNRLKDLVASAQKEEAQYQSAVMYSYSTNPLILTWPWVQNFATFRTSQGTQALPTLSNYSESMHLWIDESKRV